MKLHIRYKLKCVLNKTWNIFSAFFLLMKPFETKCARDTTGKSGKDACSRSKDLLNKYTVTVSEIS